MTGLSLVTVALFLQTRIDLDTGYGLLLPAFILMGIGMALDDVADVHGRDERREPQKAGVASGILSMSRMVGGTFGVAALGALFQHLARNELVRFAGRHRIGAAQQERLVNEPRHGLRRRRTCRPRPPTPRTTRSSMRSPAACGSRPGVAARRRGVRPPAGRRRSRCTAATRRRQPEAAATEALEAAEAA